MNCRAFADDMALAKNWKEAEGQLMESDEQCAKI